MRIATPRVELIDSTFNAADLLLFTKHTRLNMTPETLNEIRGWSEEKMEEELAYMANTIPSSWEFVDYTFCITGVSRAFTHQLVRTRHASFAQQSMRVNPMHGYGFVMPERIRSDALSTCIVEDLNDTIQVAYDQLLLNGIPAEDARCILPTNIATNIVMKVNLRTFVEMARSRLGGRTQDEYRRVMEQMVALVVARHPWTELFIYGERGRDYFREIEAFAEEHFGDDLATKGALLKIIDKMRKQA